MTTGSSPSMSRKPISSSAPFGGWSDEHRQVFIYYDLAHRGADGVPDVRVDNTVLPRWLTNPPYRQHNLSKCRRQGVETDLDQHRLCRLQQAPQSGLAEVFRSARRWRSRMPGRACLPRREPSHGDRTSQSVPQALERLDRSGSDTSCLPDPPADETFMEPSPVTRKFRTVSRLLISAKVAPRAPRDSPLTEFRCER